MFDPPPGFGDLLGDAELHAPPAQPPLYRDIDVPGVGTVRARRPLPDGVAHLAMALNSKAGPLVQQNHLALFSQQHLAEGVYDRLLFDMMVRDDMPDDALWRVLRALVTWGTERPYKAVGVLAVLAGTQWRVLRQRMSAAGITDPLGLPSMHALLDWAETLARESFTSGDADKDRYDRERFFDAIYKPDPAVLAAAREGGEVVAPAGFDPAEMEAAFDAAAAAH